MLCCIYRRQLHISKRVTGGLEIENRGKRDTAKQNQSRRDKRNKTLDNKQGTTTSQQQTGSEITKWGKHRHDWTKYKGKDTRGWNTGRRAKV